MSEPMYTAGFEIRLRLPERITPDQARRGRSVYLVRPADGVSPVGPPGPRGAGAGTGRKL